MPLSLVYAVVILLGIITITASSTAASNFTIYRSVATYADRNGVVPPEYAVLPPGEVSGRYADFTPMNFRVYQALLGDSDTADVARYVAYQTLIFLAGIYLLQRFRERLGVSTAEVRWISLGAIACSLLILPFLEDKVTFFTLPLLTLVGSTGSAVAAGAGLGVMIGWTGLGISVLPVLALRREGLRDAIRTTLAAVIVTLVMMSVAGRGAVDPLSRRSDREAQDPFWYSLWAPFGDLGSPTVRSLAFVVLSTAVFVAEAGFNYGRNRWVDYGESLGFQQHRSGETRHGLTARRTGVHWTQSTTFMVYRGCGMGRSFAGCESLEPCLRHDVIRVRGSGGNHRHCRSPDRQ